MQSSVSETKNIYLLLGSNMGDRVPLLQQALAEINNQVGDVVRVSSIYETAAWGNENQPNFLNQVVQVNTSVSPRALLKKTQAIEQQLGRERHVKWEARLIDIDILFYGDQVIDLPDLQIPHPHLAARNFTLVPLNEIAPTWIHPVTKQTITELLAQTTDPLSVYLYKIEPYEQHEL